MPKITKQRQHSQAFHPYRTNKAEDDDVPARTNINLPAAEKKSSDAQDGSTDKGLSRGQKKRLERKEHIMQKIGLKQPQMKNGPAANTQEKQTQPSKKKSNSSNNGNNKQKSEAEQAQALLLSTLDEMDDGEEEDDDDDDDERAFLAQAAQLVSSNKLKKEVAVREANRIKLVQQHPLFQENPIDAIQQHLQKITGKSIADVTAIPPKK